MKMKRNIFSLRSSFKCILLAERSYVSKKSTEHPHLYYKWNYKPLPKQTALDQQVPEFAVRSPEFNLPKTKGRLSRKVFRQRVAEIQRARQDPELEKLARNRQLLISLEEVEKGWREEFGLLELSNLSRFYGINRDLFNNENIVAKTWLDIAYNDIKIHRGNIVEPNKMLQTPSNITYESNEQSLYTIVLCNLDGHPLNSTKELVHWMVCNIPGSDIAKGETIYEYLPPLPWKGTGYHRFVFAVYEHKHKIETENLNLHASNSLKGRTFSNSSFLSSVDVSLHTLSWCQLQWDESVSSSCKLLKDITEEPIFDWEEYIEPKVEQQNLRTRLNELKYRNM